MATPQTVYVRNAPPGSPVELMVNSDRVATSAADARGDAALAVNLFANIGKTETDAYVFVERCSNLRRVLLEESSRQPPAVEAACDRKAVRDLFVVRSMTTLVVDVGDAGPSVLIRQGPAPSSWLAPGSGPAQPRVWRVAPKGLQVSAGLGLASFSDALSLACGDASQCAQQQPKDAFTVGATYWFSRFIAADIGFMRPAKAKASGDGTNFHFDSFLDARILTIAAKGGAQAGPFRMYGFGGANYHSATTSTTQTVDATSTGRGGAETFAFETGGWGWLAGGGVETWVKPRLGIYFEGGRIVLKGPAVGNGNEEGKLDDQLTFAVVGIRVRIGR